MNTLNALGLGTSQAMTAGWPPRQYAGGGVAGGGKPRCAATCTARQGSADRPRISGRGSTDGYDIHWFGGGRGYR